MLEKLNSFCLIGLITCAIDVKMNRSILEKKSSFKMLWLKFLSPEVAFYLYKSTIGSCMKYCCHAWAGAPSCYFGYCWISYKNKVHRRNVANLSLFYRYQFHRCSSELAQEVPFPYSQGRSIHYSDRLHNFSVTIPNCHKNVYGNSFFPCTAGL